MKKILILILSIASVCIGKISAMDYVKEQIEKGGIEENPLLLTPKKDDAVLQATLVALVESNNVKIYKRREAPEGYAREVSSKKGRKLVPALFKESIQQRSEEALRPEIICAPIFFGPGEQNTQLALPVPGSQVIPPLFAFKAPRTRVKLVNGKRVYDVPPRARRSLV